MKGSDKMGRFDGKVVLVTGGNRNTGLDLVEKFAREGAKVFMCHVRRAGRGMLLASIAFAIVLSHDTAYAHNEANPDAIELAPMPMPVEFKSDMDNPVPFDAGTTVTVDCQDEAAASWLALHFKEWYGKDTPRVVGGRVSPRAAADGDVRPPDGDEAYAVVADASGVKIAANSLAGVRWAAYSIRQLAIAKRGTLTTEGRILPAFDISDSPHLPFRCVHICWFPELSSAYVERTIRLAALLKFNYAILEPWGMYKSAKHPWWSWPGAKMTKGEVRRLVSIGRDLGITLIPQIASYGHAAAARGCTLKHSVLDLQPQYEPLYEPGGWNWCLTNPQTQRILRELVAEMLEDFGHPPYIHLGCDEAQPPTCPECRRRPYGELVCEHIAGLAAFAKECGARAMIGHDMLLDRHDARWKGFIAFGSKATAAMADLLPKDVIVCDWQYSLGGKEKEVRSDWPTMAYFREKGFSVVGCPWMNYATMGSMANYLAEIGGFGYMQTTWNRLYGKDLVKMYRCGASAAWGTPVRGKDGANPTSHFDTGFANALRMVGHDMKISDYNETGNFNLQVRQLTCPN